MEEITGSDQQDQSQAANDNSATVADRWHLRVKGIVLVVIEDELGRRLGPLMIEGRTGRPVRWEDENEEEDEEETKQQTGQVKPFPALFETAIPGALYNPGRNFTSAFLNQPGTYSFVFLGQSPSAVDIHLTAFTASAKLDTAFFQGIPMTNRSRASFVYNTADPLESIVLSLRERPRGKTQEIPPTAILGPNESADYIPPTTSIDINSDNVAFVSATDNPGGSGVLRTYYTTDLRTFSVYREPFVVPPDAKIVMAFSIDRNGNKEYPGALLPVLAVSQTRVLFTARLQDREIPPQKVRIFNPDPVPLTKPLEWEASTGMDTPWLFVEPRDGSTPALITLVVRPFDLNPGTYRGTVIVRARTPGTVFAERVIEVILELSDGSAGGPGVPFIQ